MPLPTAAKMRYEAPMAVWVSLLRAVNVGGHNVIPMAALTALYAELGLGSPRHLLQTGNVVFSSKGRPEDLAPRLEGAIRERFDAETKVLLRTADELRTLVARSPFATRDLPPAKVVVFFFEREPTPDAQSSLAAAHQGVEELHFVGRELFVYFPDGQGRSKLTPTRIERSLKLSGTARNWNTVMKLAAMTDAVRGA